MLHEFWLPPYLQIIMDAGDYNLLKMPMMKLMPAKIKPLGRNKAKHRPEIWNKILIFSHFEIMTYYKCSIDSLSTLQTIFIKPC